MRKVYGESQDTKCLFCDKQATTQNEQGLPSCNAHTSSKLEDIRCNCGAYLDIKQSKWGAFFVCENCGSLSLQKGLSLRNNAAQSNTGFKLNKKYRQEKTKKVEYDSRRVYTIEELESLWSN